jgi:preprotein translocase subunit SecG
MQQILLSLHVLISLLLIGLVLVQHGKGADAGAAFGAGASGSVFGSKGSTPFLVKVTTLLAVLFFASSLTLTYLSSHASDQGLLTVPTPGVEQKKQQQDLPMVEKTVRQGKKSVPKKK